MAITPSRLSADTEEYKAELASRVLAIMERDGYTLMMQGLPEPDNRLVRAAIAKALSSARVASKKDRFDNAMRFLHLVGDLFPSAVKPAVFEDYDDVDDRLWAKAVWDALIKLVQGQLRTVGLEELVSNMYGLTICRVVLHTQDNEPVQFIYLTDDIGCILQDYTGPRSEAIRLAQDKMVKALRPVIQRHPQHGKRLISEFKKTGNQLLDTGASQLQLALQMTNPNGNSANGADATPANE
jgi:hypothetical protein